MARGDQLARQWSLLHLLKRGRQSRRQLAEALGVTRKTIARDIDALSLFPITEEHEGIDVFYSLLDDRQAPGLWFSPEEVTTLMFAGDMVSKALEKTPYYKAFSSIMRKIAGHKRGDTYRKLHRFPEVFQVYSSSERTHRRVSPAQLDALIQAASEQKCVRMRYFTVHRQAMTERVVEPFVLYQSPHGFRLIAYCRKREDVVFFSVNQIRELEVLDESFDLEARRFDLETFLETSFDDMRSLPVVDVRLHVRFPTAHWAKDRIYHPSQEVTEVEDGIEITFRAGGVPAIAACVMGMGTDCTVLEPALLREEVARRARVIAGLYEEDGPT